MITPDAKFDALDDATAVRYVVHIYRRPSTEGEGQLSFDILAVPGGQPGSNTISQTPRVQQLVREYIDKEKIVGMICAGMC